jgi:hypothetical protein
VELDYLIRYEVENTGLDFKAVQYRKNDELLKDLVAMANSLVEGTRYIVVGVKVHPSGERRFVGIPEGEFIDDASYQELIRTNVEPPLTFSYSPYSLDGHILGVFKIGPNDDLPYMMRKDYLPLKHGDSWIRRGTSTSRLTRPDLDRILAQKHNSVDFSTKLKVGFDSNFAGDLTLPYLTDAKLPSTNARDEILRELEKAKQNPDALRIGVPMMFGGGYDGMSIAQLESALNTVYDDYSDRDYYYLLERNSQRLNLTLLNSADHYLEDVTLELRFPRKKGLIVAQNKPKRPLSTLDYLRRKGPVSDPDAHLYPRVDFNDNWVCVQNSLGDLRHGIATKGFAIPLRVVLGVVLEGQVIELLYSIHAKNLRTPITGVLRLAVGGAFSPIADDEK